MNCKVEGSRNAGQTNLKEVEGWRNVGEYIPLYLVGGSYTL